MPEVAELIIPQRVDWGRAQSQINARLFYLLAQFVIWVEQYRALAASDPELATLLEPATAALCKGGILEYPSGSTPSGIRAKNTVENSQSLASPAVPGDGEV
jgi:hypothetical protein